MKKKHKPTDSGPSSILVWSAALARSVISNPAAIHLMAFALKQTN